MSSAARWLALSSATLACAAPPSPECPSTEARGPAATTTATPATSQQAVEEPRKSLPSLSLSWSQRYDSGDLSLAPARNDLALVPTFMGATVEGARAALLDASGRPRWERLFPGVGAGAVCASPGGRVHAIAVDSLDWPKTEAAYGRQRVVSMDAAGVTTWSAPKKVELVDLVAASDEELLVSATFEGKIRLSPSIELGAQGTSGAFVASLKGGKVAWAVPADSPMSLLRAGSSALYAIGTPDGGEGLSRTVTQLTAQGAPIWRLELDAACRYEDAAIGPAGHLFIMTAAGCSGPSWKGEREGESRFQAHRSCRLSELAPESGKVVTSAIVPGCLVRADDEGVAVVDLLDGPPGATVTLLDATLAPSHVLVAYAPACDGGQWWDVGLTAGSLYLLGGCMGQRIGTMFNSPYARAYAASTSYLERYVRP